MKNFLRSAYDYIKRDLISFVLVMFTLVLGVWIGYMTRGKHELATAPGESLPTDTAEKGPTVWTCSMHPQIQLQKSGKCPLCGMNLIPLVRESGSDVPRQLVMSPAAIALAEIETQPVERKFMVHSLSMVGKVHFDETRLASITAWFPGRLDRLFVDYTGVMVNKGDHLAEIYSPDLLAAQQELLEAERGLKNAKDVDADTHRMSQSLAKAAAEKLRLWGLTPDQVESIKQNGKAEDHMTIYARAGGIVIEKNAVEGTWVETGTKIYSIADLSRVWVFLDAYESDMPWVHYGQQVEFNTEAYPGHVFSGRISFVSPVLNDMTRTIRLRVNVPNPDGRLKPQMFVNAEIKSRIAQSGQVVDEVMAGKWISPMHPEILKDAPGDCPICGMDLVPVESVYPNVTARAEPALVIPASAPLITGKRAVVYVKVNDAKEPTFQGRVVVLGPRAGNSYIVQEGLAEGELVVTRGNFKIDSALQIRANFSMMNPDQKTLALETGNPESLTPAGNAKVFTSAEVPEPFKKSLTPFMRAYLAFQKYLAADDAAASLQELSKLPEALKKVQGVGMAEPAAKAWDEISSEFLKLLEHVSHGHFKALPDMRKLNIELSGRWIETVKTFGLAGETELSVAHCPMAADGKGADWLQEGSKIQNPYFGKAMLECGDVKETLKRGAEHEH